MLKRIIYVFVLFLLSGCGGMAVEDFKRGQPPLDLFAYFDGETQAWGIFEDRFGTIRRQFQVQITGKIDGETLTLNEEFQYADGEESTRVWTIRKTGANTFEGSAPDVIGTAIGKSAGNALNWTYDLDLVVGDSSYRVTFDDWMFRQKGNVLINIANVTKWGFDVGRVTLFFKKAGS